MAIDISRKELWFLMHPRRDTYGERANEPISDVLVALDLLSRGWNDRTIRQLEIRHSTAGTEAVIVVRSYCGGYTGEEHSGTDTYALCPRLADDLIKERLVQGKPYMGFTSQSEFLISDWGYRECNQLFDVHDRVVEGNRRALSIKPGTYRNYKDRRFAVIGSGGSSVDGKLTVFLKPLEGKTAGILTEVPFEEFTQCIINREW